MLFADDVSQMFFPVFSLSQQGLHQKIVALEKYCQDWALAVNITKTKFIIFNKQRALVKKFKIYFREKKIETVKQYVYLDFTFIPLKHAVLKI